MSLTDEEKKEVLDEAKRDTPRNRARKVLVESYELMAAAVQQQLPPWDRRWLEFNAIDHIQAALSSGDLQGGDLDIDGIPADQHDLGDNQDRCRADGYLHFDADPGKGGGAAE